MAYDANTNVQNEQTYLNNLIAKGGGQATWATNQMKTLDAFARKQASLSTPTQAPTQQVQIPTQQTPQVNPQMQQMLNMNTQMGEANFQQQKAQLDMMLNAQVAQLKMAYDQAITDGKISVRDAETEFNTQKSAIEQQAYLDAERTGLYAQDMGIQNSQQAIGLMQGDDARKNSLINQNMTTRDKRVNDIKDRLNSVRTQKSLDLAKAQADHGYGILGARADANKQVAQNAFGLMQDDYSANRDQGFAQQNIETQFQNSLKSATHENNLAIERMNIQQDFDLDKMAQALQDDIKKMGVQYGYSSALESQSASNAMARIGAEYKAKAQAEKDSYDLELQRALNGVTKGTKEYDVIKGTADRALKNKLMELHVSTIYEATAKDILSAPTTKPIAPIDYSTTDQYGLLGNVINKFKNYDANKADYDAKMSSYNRYTNITDAFKEYMPWAQ